MAALLGGVEMELFLPSQKFPLDSVETLDKSGFTPQLEEGSSSLKAGYLNKLCFYLPRNI